MQLNALKCEKNLTPKWQIIHFRYGCQGETHKNQACKKRLPPISVLLLVTTILLSLVSSAQYSVAGKVVDSDGKAIEFATVTVSIDTILLSTTTTNNEGYFVVSNLGRRTYTFQLSYLKYAKQNFSIDVSKDTVVSITLLPQTVNLKTVTVLSKKPLIEKRGDRFIFTPSKALSEGSNALDLLRIAPLIKYDEANDIFSIIGKAGTIVYINNRKTQMPKEMILELLRSLPAENLKNIEIITNPGSEYAATITGGIININIKRQLYEGWLGNLAVQTQQAVYNTTLLNGSVNYRKGKIALQIIPVANNSVNFNTGVNTLDYKDGQKNKIDSRFFRRYQVLGGGVNADLYIDKKNFIGYNGWFSSVMGKSNISNITTFSKNTQLIADSLYTSPITGTDVYTYNFGNINYHHDFDAEGSKVFDINVDYNSFFQRQKNDGTFNKIKPSGEIEREAARYTNNLPQEFFNLSQKIEYAQALSKSVRLSMGGQYSNTRVDYNLKYYFWDQTAYKLDYNISNHFYYNERYLAGFVSLDKTFNDKWSATIGLRAEKTQYITEKKNAGLRNDSSYFNLFPSLSTNYAPNQKHQFGFSVSRKIIRPNWELLFPGRVYNNANYFSENNPFLQPSLFYNGQLSYTLNGKHSVILDYTRIKNSYTNFIIPIVENGVSSLKNTYLNYGTVSSWSLILSLSHSMFNGIYEWNINPSFNYSLYKADQSIVQRNIENYSVNCVFNNTIYLSKKRKVTAFVTFNYIGKHKDISSEILNSLSSLTLNLKKVVNKFSFYLIFDDIYNGNSRLRNNFYGNQLLNSNYFETNSYNRSISFKIRYKFGNNQLKTNKNRGTANEELRQRTKG